MTEYEKIIAEHQALQKALTDHPDEAEMDRVLDLISRVREAGRHIGDPQQREQLRAILKRWGAYVYEWTEEFPPTQLAPLESYTPAAKGMPSLPGSLPPWALWVGIGVVVVALIAVIGSILIDGAEVTPTPTPDINETLTVTPPPPSPTPELATLVLYNDSGATICYLYTTIEGGERVEQLGDTVVVEPGGSQEVTLPAGNYDKIEAQDCNEGNLGLLRDTTLSGTFDWPISGDASGGTALLTLYNNSGQSICAVYISPSTETTWGENQLEPNETVPNGERRFFSVFPGTYDLRADDCQGTVVDERWQMTIGREPVKWVIEVAPPAPTPTPTATPTPTVTPTPGPTPTPNPQIIRPDNVDQIAQLRQFAGHDGAVLQIAFSPDGNTLASGGADGTVRLWPLAAATRFALTAGPTVQVLEAHGGWVQAVAFSPDGKWLASGGNDRVIRLWDLRDGANIQVFAEFETQEGFVFDVAFSPDGSWLAASSGDGTVRLWDLRSGSALAAFRGGEGTVYDIAFSPVEPSLAVTSLDGTVRILGDLPNGAERCRRNIGQGLSLAFAPDGRSLATGNASGEISIFDVRSVAQDRSQLVSDVCTEAGFFPAYSGDVNGVNALAYSPDGTLLASAGQDGVVKVWATAEGQRVGVPVATLAQHQGSVETVAFSPDGRGLASGGADGLILLWGMPGQ